MIELVAFLTFIIVCFVIYFFQDPKGENRSKTNNKYTYKPPRQQEPDVNSKDLIWVSDFLQKDKTDLVTILSSATPSYNSFRMPKRSGGFRVIAAPNNKLLSTQKTIYQRVLAPISIHPAATGFRPKKSIVDNAKAHLGKKQVLKTDIHDFFGSIKIWRIREVFESMGYPKPIADILANLCCYKKKLPQGAPTSPVLSNIVAYKMDVSLTALAKEYNLEYTRYADDLTFSGDEIVLDTILPLIEDILFGEGFALNAKKTQLLSEKKRKIITGISISSGNHLTVPKAKKREMRKNIHFILTKGLEEHQRFIGSTDPAYLERIIGYLHFWYSVEPESRFVRSSLIALKRLQPKN